MQRVNVTWGHILRVWFAFIWRAVGVFCLLCGISFVTTVVCAFFTIKFAGWSEHQAVQSLGPYYLAGLALAFPLAGLFAFRLLLQAKFSGFDLALLAAAPDDPDAARDD